jgi:glyoxylase-like metal-dependent hydrolase (beta-lactamase superfamily II)
MPAQIFPFLDKATETFSYIAADPATKAAAIIDPVLDYDPASGRIATQSADAILNTVAAEGLEIILLLETHVHADHLSAGAYLKKKLGAPAAIGSKVKIVQRDLPSFFGAECRVEPGYGFDHLFEDGETFRIGSLEAKAIVTPGHTPADMTYIVEDAAFVGDTIFMADYGTARCDFPGGDARAMYRSIRRILELPPRTRLFMCHDYAPGGRAHECETTVAKERAENIHVRDGISEDDFAAMRTAKDKTLATPRLFFPSLQTNIRGGELPAAEADGRRYFKIPLTAPAGWP